MLRVLVCRSGRVAQVPFSSVCCWRRLHFRHTMGWACLQLLSCMLRWEAGRELGQSLCAMWLWYGCCSTSPGWAARLHVVPWRRLAFRTVCGICIITPRQRKARYARRAVLYMLFEIFRDT